MGAWIAGVGALVSSGSAIVALWWLVAAVRKNGTLRVKLEKASADTARLEELAAANKKYIARLIAQNKRAESRAGKWLEKLAAAGGDPRELFDEFFDFVPSSPDGDDHQVASNGSTAVPGSAPSPAPEGDALTERYL